MPSAVEKAPSGSEPSTLITSCSLSSGKDTLTVSFYDATFVFHAQWLHDARCDRGPSRDAANAFCQQLKVAYIQGASICGSGIKTTLAITWDDGQISPFPAVWLRLLAPLVATHPQATALNGPIIPKGWRANTLVIPEISYQKISRPDLSNEEFLATKTWIFDTLLLDSAPGIIKITDLPDVDVYSESSQKNNLLTQILKRLFGSVFQHSMRGPDETFKIASHYHESAKRAVELPNYDTSGILLPHADHSHYDNPARVQGLHAIEGTSQNTFVHSFAALATLYDEDPDLYDALCAAPMVLGRVAQFYSPPLFQTTVDTAVRKKLGFPEQVKCVRWHPHLAGYLLSPFDEFDRARRAHRKFQEIMSRDSHMLRIMLRPGDLYVWDNFRVLHGREKVFDVPRTAVGQTVIEQVVNDQYRVLKMGWLKEFIDEDWLVQTPTGQLDNLVGLVKSWVDGKFGAAAADAD
jgi:alpha-ketoglutarate-dependent taurine dioxygenase